MFRKNFLPLPPIFDLSVAVMRPKKSRKKVHYRLRVKPNLRVILMSRQQKNAFIMHSNERHIHVFPVATVPLRIGAIPILCPHVRLRGLSRVPLLNLQTLNYQFTNLLTNFKSL
jgi:hypothetical protein